MTSEDIAKNIEERINLHITGALDAKLSDVTEYNIKMANQWIEVLSNYRSLPNQRGMNNDRP